LLNVRDLTDMSEASYSELIEVGKKIGIPAVESYNLNSIDGINEMIKDMAADEEGFVAFDGKNRVKIKNAKYILRHKSETEFTQKDIFTIIKENEKDEFLGLIERYTELYNQAEAFWNKLLVAGYKFRDLVHNTISEVETKKAFALTIQPHINDFNRFFVSNGYKMMDDNLNHGVFGEFDPENILRGIDNKTLNDLFNKHIKTNF
jgi:hypothetical protein